MTLRPVILVIASVLVVPAIDAARLQSPAQRTAEAQLASPKLDSTTTVTGLELTATPLRDIVGAVAKAGGITVRFHSAVTNLDALSSVKLPNTTVEDALRSVLDPQALAFKATSAKSVFIYPNTPENREKYTESVRAFAIVKADLIAMTNALNRALTVAADDLRPTIVTDRAARTITARATPDMMARIAKVIADNDK